MLAKMIQQIWCPLGRNRLSINKVHLLLAEKIGTKAISRVRKRDRPLLKIGIISTMAGILGHSISHHFKAVGVVERIISLLTRCITNMVI